MYQPLVDEMFLAGEIRETSQTKVLKQLLMLNSLEPLALSSKSLKPILWDGGREGERRVVASQLIKVSFHANKNRWITEVVDGASYRTTLAKKSYVWKYQFSREQWRENGKPFWKNPSQYTRPKFDTSISPSSAVELNTTSALANYATEAVMLSACVTQTLNLSELYYTKKRRPVATNQESTCSPRFSTPSQTASSRTN
uniref:Uncharacterized protein n=1 Tax=Timema bartmani TaxID=61472 RepID=A0A7R9EWJ6_9NEOP|nr:unnamed protein product [Timema bartmani]